MQFKYFTCDVFTRDRFGGNQLAVLPDARGLSTRQMQQIAREFNYSETTFVLPAEQGHTRKVRIFTPVRELPFAGHPNIGTAFVLATNREFGPIEGELTVTFEEGAGLVPITFPAGSNGCLRCELLAPQGLTLGPTVAPELIAAALSLAPSDIHLEVHPPQVAGVGFPFVIVELQDTDALARAHCHVPSMETLNETGIVPDILLYAQGSGDVDIRARMFAPLDGIPEDPATGSAICALAALLSHCDQADTAEFSWRIAQGVEMGRPSMLLARTQKKDGVVEATWIAGDCVMVCEGVITLDPASSIAPGCGQGQV